MQVSLLISLQTSEVIWNHSNLYTLVQVVAYCLTEPSNFLKRFGLIINVVLWHSPRSNLTGILNVHILEMSLQTTTSSLQPHPRANKSMQYNSHILSSPDSVVIFTPKLDNTHICSLPKSNTTDFASYPISPSINIISNAWDINKSHNYHDRNTWKCRGYIYGTCQYNWSIHMANRWICEDMDTICICIY